MRANTSGAIVALVVCAVVAVIAALWVTSGLQADLSQRTADRQSAGAALLTGMLDQETGVRGYLLNGRDDFLAPYRAGGTIFARAAQESRQLAGGDDRGRRALAVVVGRARAWRRLAAPAVAKVRRDGPAITAGAASALRRKTAMDRFRESQRSYLAWLGTERKAAFAGARRETVLIVLVLGLLFSGVGVLVVGWVRRVRTVNESRYQQLVRSLPGAGVLTFDHDLRFTSVDGSALEALDWSDGSVIGKQLRDLVAADQLPVIEPRYRAALAGKTERFDFDSATTGQSWALEISPLRDDNGSVLGGLVLLRNITDRRRAESDAAQRTQDIETLGTVARELARADDEIEAQQAICDAAHELAESLTAAVWLPDGRGGLVSHVALGMAPPDTRIAIAGSRHGAARSFATAEPLLVTDASTSDACESSIVAAVDCTSVYFAPITNDDTAKGVLALSWTDRVETLSKRLQVTLDMLCHEGAVALDRVALLKRLDDLARTDPLTGLANRRVWDEQVGKEMERARRHHEPLAVAILDLDHFKDYNDSRGHGAGDRLLRSLSAALTSEVRDTDTVARLGGEEFGVLLPRCKAHTAQGLLERLRGTVPDGETCSAGYATWDGTEPAEQLLKRADDALYDAKRTGRDRTCAATAPAP